MRRMVVYALLAVVLTSCAPKPSAPLTQTRFIMGTVCSIKLYTGQSKEALAAAFERIAQIDRAVNANTDGSEVSEINRAAGKQAVKVGTDTIEIVKLGLYYSAKSEGAFDITIGRLARLWSIGFDDARVPSAAEIQEVLPYVDYREVEIDGTAETVFLRREGMRLDLGAVAKGYAADAAAAVLREYGVTGAIIDLGGNVYALGTKDGGDWAIGIQHPLEERSEIIGTVHYTDKSVVTAGIYERYLTAGDGTQYHHILNPVDGYPYDNELAGVTVISDSSVDGDGFSTAAFAKGLAGGIELIESVPGIEAIFITKERDIYTTKGLKGNFELR